MTHYQLVSENKTKSWLIIIGFVAFIATASYLIATGLGYGLDVVGMTLIFSGIGSFASYFWADKIILGISGARPASREEFFDFYTVTENLCLGQKMPVPKLYVIEDSAMNAFATGRDPEHAVVCATTGLLSRLNRAEIEGVVAHELSHIKNYDILLMSVVSVLVGSVALLADWLLRMSHWGGGRRRDDRGSGDGQIQAILFVVALLLAFLSPIIAQLIQLAISRNREFLADATGAGISKNPEGLAKALEKISADREPLEAANKATAHLYIANPLKNLRGGVSNFAKFFMTHPPVEERIAALRGIARK
ncbi:MAG: M48 family metallopeptidase [Patescibacteria group bacterium]